MRDSDSPRTAPVQAGELIAGKYQVERLLGAGGIGVVVAARHLQLDRLVAIKFLLPELVYNREVVARFSREARAAASLRSEHVAAVLDVGELSDGAPYMVMEYLEGCDLASLLSTRGALKVEDAVSYVLQAGEAIAEAHAAGIVHRDLKPANLFLTTRADGSPIVKVLDFGISKNAAALESIVALSLTSSTAVIGTPLYMSPEQMQSARGVDGRADLWSLGAILYELLAGSPPFLAQTLPQLCIAVMQQEPTSLHRVRPDVPEGLSAVVARCLAKERSNRYSSVSELAYDLARYSNADVEQTLRRIAGVSRGIPPLLSDEAIPLVSAPKTPAQHPPDAVHGHGGAGRAEKRPVAATMAMDSSAASTGATRGWPSSLLVRVALGVGVLFVLGVGAFMFSLQSGKPESVPPPLPRSPSVAVEASGAVHGTSRSPSESEMQFLPIPSAALPEGPPGELSNTASSTADTAARAAGDTALVQGKSAGSRLAGAGKRGTRSSRGTLAGSPSQAVTAAGAKSTPPPVSKPSARPASADDLMADRE